MPVLGSAKRSPTHGVISYAALMVNVAVAVYVPVLYFGSLVRLQAT